MLLDDLMLDLEAAGIAQLEVNAFKGTLPESPDACLALLEYPGGEPEFIHNTPGVVGLERARCQLTVRDADYQTGRSRIETAAARLSLIVNRTLGAARYVRVRPLQSPFLLRMDANNRPVFAVNFEVRKAPG